MFALLKFVNTYIDPNNLWLPYGVCAIQSFAYVMFFFSYIFVFSTPLLELSECIHTTVIKDMCADCGADLRQNENVGTQIIIIVKHSL